jgi:hypothetical protein
MSFSNIITQILNHSEKNFNTTTLHDVSHVFNSFTTLECYSISKLLVLHAYLSDLSVDYPLTTRDKLFAKEEESTLEGRIHSQLGIINRILNLPESVPSTVKGDTLMIINAYGYKSEHCKGRMYGHRNTMTLISRQCRYYLFKDSYFDLDLKNAHPTILMAYAKSNNIEANVLKAYVSNREEFLQEIVNRDKITRNEAKTAVLRCLNLVSNVSLSKTLKALHEDIVRIRNHLYKNNIEESITDLGSYTMSRDSFKEKTIEKQKVSLQAQYCGSEESWCLEILYEVCLHKGNLNRDVTLNKSTRNISFIPFFDGAYLLFEDLKHKSEVSQILTDTNEFIYPNEFVLKEFEPEWDYLKEEDLVHYEQIVSFLNGLSKSEMSKLLDFIDVQPFSLDEEKLKDIITSIKSPADKKLLNAGLNEQVNIFIYESSKTFKHLVRRKILSIFKQNRKDELFEHTLTDKRINNPINKASET